MGFCTYYKYVMISSQAFVREQYLDIAQQAVSLKQLRLGQRPGYRMRVIKAG